MIPRKQTANQEQWLKALENVSKAVSKQQIDALVSRTVREIQKVTKGKKAAYCWSGGKDSIALEFVTRKDNLPYEDLERRLRRQGYAGGPWAFKLTGAMLEYFG